MVGSPAERKRDMSEGQRVSTPSATTRSTLEAGSVEAALQEAINEGARQSWKLVSVTQDPTAGDGVILVRDTSGFFSAS